MKDLSLIKKELAIAKKAIANIEALLSLESNVSVKGEDPRVLKYLYAIECEGGWYYIGQTANLDKRFRVHRNGKGSWVTREYPPLGIVETRELGVMTTSEAMLFENDLTLEYMGRYGVDKVRGGHFIQRNKKHFAHLLHR